MTCDASTPKMEFSSNDCYNIETLLIQVLEKAAGVEPLHESLWGVIGGFSSRTERPEVLDGHKKQAFLKMWWIWFNKCG